MDVSDALGTWRYRRGPCRDWGHSLCNGRQLLPGQLCVQQQGRAQPGSHGRRLGAGPERGRAGGEGGGRGEGGPRTCLLDEGQGAPRGPTRPAVQRGGRGASRACGSCGARRRVGRRRSPAPPALLADAGGHAGRGRPSVLLRWLFAAALVFLFGLSSCFVVTSSEAHGARRGRAGPPPAFPSASCSAACEAPAPRSSARTAASSTSRQPVGSRTPQPPWLLAAGPAACAACFPLSSAVCPERVPYLPCPGPRAKAHS